MAVAYVLCRRRHLFRARHLVSEPREYETITGKVLWHGRCSCGWLGTAHTAYGIRVEIRDHLNLMEPYDTFVKMPLRYMWRG